LLHLQGFCSARCRQISGDRIYHGAYVTVWKSVMMGIIRSLVPIRLAGCLVLCERRRHPNHDQIFFPRGHHQRPKSSFQESCWSVIRGLPWVVRPPRPPISFLCLRAAAQTLGPLAFHGARRHAFSFMQTAQVIHFRQAHLPLGERAMRVGCC
jgi:hypothetical protein